MFIIAPINDVKGLHDYPTFQQAMIAVQGRSYARAGELWEGAKPGGILPLNDQFGVGPFRKEDMSGDTADNTLSGSVTFRRNLTTTGWQDIFNYRVRKDMIHAFVGFLITDDELRITHLRMELGANKFPVWNIEEAKRYDKFGIILNTDPGRELVADPSTTVLLRIRLETVGVQRVVPLGLQLFRRSDMVITET